MTKQQTFGRRVNSRNETRQLVREPVIAASSPELSPRDMVPPQISASTPISVSTPIGASVEDELREWKKSRKGNYKFPWRPLSWMASGCFGIASIVLPSSVNNVVEWLLWALTGASFYAGFRMRQQKKKG